MAHQIALTDAQLDEFRQLAATEKRSIEQLIRQAVEEFLAGRRSEDRDAFESGFGLWGEGEDGLAVQERLRNEW